MSIEKETIRLRIRKTDSRRLDDIRVSIYQRRNEIKSKVDTITFLLDEFDKIKENSNGMITGDYLDNLF